MKPHISFEGPVFVYTKCDLLPTIRN